MGSGFLLPLFEFLPPPSAWPPPWQGNSNCGIQPSVRRASGWFRTGVLWHPARPPGGAYRQGVTCGRVRNPDVWFRSDEPVPLGEAAPASSPATRGSRFPRHSRREPQACQLLPPGT